MPAKFKLGRIHATRAAHELMIANGINPLEYIARHAGGDWGSVCEGDQGLNDEALKNGNRLLSAYAIDPTQPCEGHGDNCMWVITEHDRSVTTILLPSDY
jgi:hypothetical protein